MHTSGGLRIDPVVLDAGGPDQEIEVVVPYTEWALAEAVLRRTESLTAGLNPTVRLIAVHAVPYPLPFGCPSMAHARLVEQLVDLASRCPFRVEAQVALARFPDEGWRQLLKPGCLVMIGTRKHLWRTREEKLARDLARDGYRVVLLHIE